MLLARLNVLTKVLIDSLKKMIYVNVFGIYIWSIKAVFFDWFSSLSIALNVYFYDETS